MSFLKSLAIKMKKQEEEEAARVLRLKQEEEERKRNDPYYGLHDNEEFEPKPYKVVMAKDSQTVFDGINALAGITFYIDDPEYGIKVGDTKEYSLDTLNSYKRGYNKRIRQAKMKIIGASSYQSMRTSGEILEMGKN